MIRTADVIDRINRAIGRAASWLAIALVALTLLVVLLRYAFGIGFVPLQESLLYVHAALFLLAAAWVLQNNGHVRVDIFYAEASPRRKAIVDLAGALLLLIPFALAVIGWGVPYAARSFAILERSRESGGLPFVYLLKSLIPLFGALMLAQGLSQAIRAASVIRSAPR